MLSLIEDLPINRLRLEAALRDHRLDRPLEEREFRLRLLAMEIEIERQSDRITKLESPTNSIGTICKG